MKTLSSSNTFNFIHQSFIPCNCNPSSSSSSSSSLVSFKKTPKTTSLQKLNTESKQQSKRVYFLDVNPLCYEGTNPSLHYFAKWLKLFLSHQVTQSHPVIAVFDGERGSEYRRNLLPSYKANRRKFVARGGGGGGSGHVGRFYGVISDVLQKCNVPVSVCVYLLIYFYILCVFFFLGI